MIESQHPAIIPGDRRRCILLFALATGAGLAALQWFFPWLDDFSARAHCTEIAGYNGSIVLFSAVFVGITASVFLLTLWLAYISGKVLQSGQAPPPGARVCRDTVPVTGRRARVRAGFGLAMPLMGLALLGWGIQSFRDIRDELILPNLEKLQASCVETGTGSGYNSSGHPHPEPYLSGEPPP